MADRVPIGWPKGKKLAVLVNVMMEGYSDGVAPGGNAGPGVAPLKPGFPDTRGISWVRYGPVTGMPRLLDILKKKNVRATVYVSGIIAERYPELVRQIGAEGHEIAAHSYAQDILPVYLDEKADRENVERCRRIILDVTGRSPKGWNSPRGTPGPKTAQHLSELDFLYYGDVFDTDLPYLQKFGEKRLVAIPFTNEVNDLSTVMRYGNPPQAYNAKLQRLLDKWYRVHDVVGCLDVTVHAHCFGRPYGAVEFEEALSTVTSLEWVWIPTHEEIAQLYLDSEKG